MKDNELLENYSEPVHNKKYLETKIKSYEGKINTRRFPLYLSIGNIK